MKATTSEKHERTHRIVFDHKSLQLLIAEAGARAVEFERPKIGSPGVSYKVTFEAETKGSPSYTIGQKAIVTIIEDMTPQAAPDLIAGDADLIAPDTLADSDGNPA